MDMLGFLFVILILTIAGSAQIMTNAILRLTAAVAAISAGVTRVAAEVSETAQAIRDHATGDGGISQSTLLGLADQLEGAATQLTAAGDSLDQLQHQNSDGSGDAAVDTNGAADAGVGSGTVGADGGLTDSTGLGDQSGAGVGSGTVGADGGSDGLSGVNQNGVGSDFETGGDRSGTEGQSL